MHINIIGFSIESMAAPFGPFSWICLAAKDNLTDDRKVLFVILIVSFAFPFVGFAYHLPSAEASSKLYGDFNGDDKDDLVIGVPGEDSD